MNKKNIRVRKGQAPGKLSRDDFRARFFDKFTDPAFSAEASALKRIEIIAWDGYTRHRKAPLTHPAGRGYADPSYDLSDEWRATRQAIRAAEKQRKSPASPSRVLVISGADRNDGTCPGEMSKTFRLSRIVIDTLKKARIQCDDLDLSHEGVRRALSDWLDWMGLIDAGTQARLDRYIGYYKPYATSHDELDQDRKVQEEVRNVARAVAKAVRELRAGHLSQPDDKLEAPRQK